MIQIVRFKITQTTEALGGAYQTQLVKVGTACKLVGGKVWFSGTSAGATITVNKASINDGDLSYLIPAWTPTPFVSGVAQSGYTVTGYGTLPATGTYEQLTKASGSVAKTPLLMNIGADAVITAGYMPFVANDILYVVVPHHDTEVPVFFIDLEFEI